MRTHALFSSSWRFSRALLFVALILFSVASARAVASEILVKTDSLPEFPTTHQLYNGGPLEVLLVAGGRMGVGLASPVDGTIVGVQIMWGSINGGAPPAQESAIRIWSLLAGDPYHPVATLATIDSPILTDGGTNEFRYLDPATNLVPLSVPITAGTFYFVDLELGEDIGAGPGAATLLMSSFDAGGVLFFQFNSAAPATGYGGRWIGGWTEGVFGGGNVGIRMIVQPVPEPSTYALAAIGVIGLLAFRRRKSVA